MRLCHVNGVKYVVDKQHGVEVTQMGKYHLMITVKGGKGARVIFDAGVNGRIDAVDITQPSDKDVSRFLLSTDAIPWIEYGKAAAQLLVFGDGINLVFDVTA